jgi:cytochrome c biogenesis protein CcdA
LSAVTILIIAGIALYLLPSLIATCRRHSNVAAIEALNILLGWTFLGWVVSLVWSLTDNVKPKKEPEGRLGLSPERIAQILREDD